ncbi:MAG: putative LPS assembly protein LptD, partial [Longimicrobiales bacterium]|nr:putative LPS assembly protein LptD [Longimicrobiales bacterium]
MTRGAARPLAGGLTLGVLAALLSVGEGWAAPQAADPGAAQQTSAGNAATPGDTVPAVDSTRIRVLRQLEALSRPPGADTLLAAQDTGLAVRAGTGAAQTDARGGDRGIGAQDSLALALRELDGYVITNYSGARAEFEARDRQLVLRGEGEERPRVSRQGMALAADSAIVYSEIDERVRTVGGAEYTPDVGDPVASRTMVLDLTTQRGSALAAQTRYSQGGTDWYVSGDLPSVESDLVYGSHTSFTSCDLEEPHYHFETDEIKIHQGNILVARPVRLYFADVPVAWLPFIAQSLAQGRASGLLTPRFSVNDIVRSSTGYSRRISNVGFYWAMSDYTDATVALDWWSDNFTAVTGQFRYNWARQFLQGGLDYRHYWAANGSIQRAFSTRHSWQISERTRFSMDARYASSESFVRQNSFDP